MENRFLFRINLSDAFFHLALFTPCPPVFLVGNGFFPQVFSEALIFSLSSPNFFKMHREISIASGFSHSLHHGYNALKSPASSKDHQIQQQRNRNTQEKADAEQKHTACSVYQWYDFLHQQNFARYDCQILPISCAYRSASPGISRKSRNK